MNRIISNAVVRFFLLLVFALVSGTTGYSQQITPQNLEKLQIMEDSLVGTADSMYESFIPDTHIMLSEKFVKQLVRALKIPNSYYYPFDSLKHLINIIYPDDNSFRIFNWEITAGNIPKRYYGAIQMPQEQLKLYGLLDYSEQVGKGAEDSILSGGKWFGALYYRIMTQEVQGRRLYTLFGLNDEDRLVTRKVLDPLMIGEKGPRFGAPIFGVGSTNFPRQRVNRFVLEYKKGVNASMNWNEEKQVIIFDKLVSITNDPGRKYTYAPSGGYDGFVWRNENWNYVQDLIPVTILRDGEAPPDQK